MASAVASACSVGARALVLCTEMALDLTEKKCLELNKQLTGALEREDWGIARDVLRQLKEADASSKLRVGCGTRRAQRSAAALCALRAQLIAPRPCLSRPQILASTKLSKTVFKLSKVRDADAAEAATLLVERWRQLAKGKPEGKAEAPADAAAPAKRPRDEEAEASPEREAALPEPKAAKPESSGAKLEPSGLGASSSGGGGGSKPAVLMKTGNPVRDSVREKLRAAFLKGIHDNTRLLHEFDVDPVSLAMECEARAPPVPHG